MFPKRVPDRESDHLPDGFDLRDLTAYYYGATTAVDDLVGGLLQALQENGLEDNTIVVLLPTTERTWEAIIWFNKDLLIEESIRVPMVFRYPKGLQPSVSRAQVASTIDIMPTVLELCGLPLPDSVQGQSLLRVMRGERETLERNYAIVETEFYHLGIRAPSHLYGMEIRDTGFIGEWPYFSNEPGKERVCFFDLRTDPFQERNLAGTGEQSELTAELRSSLAAWNESTRWMDGAPPAIPEWMSKQAMAEKSTPR